MKALTNVFCNTSITPSPQPVFTPQTTTTPEYRQSAYPEPTNTQRMEDITNHALPHHPDTTAGQTLYAAQISLWTSTHVGKGPNEFCPYPLTPGTEPVATNECWTCGKHPHRGLSCGHSAVPDIEQQWRRIAGGIHNRLQNEAYTSLPINLVDVQTESITKEEFEADIEQRHQKFDYYEGQGKGMGSLN